MKKNVACWNHELKCEVLVGGGEFEETSQFDLLLIESLFEFFFSNLTQLE